MALAFVLPHEKTCCELTRKILDRESGVYLIMRGGTVNGVFFFVDDDILIPCLSGIRGCGLKALASFLEGKRIFCISALEEELSKIRSVFFRLSRPPRLRESRRYFFLEYQDRAAAREAIAGLPEEFRIQMAGPGDEAALFPLHLSYMKEEVLLSGWRLNEEFERGQLREALAGQIIALAVAGSPDPADSAGPADSEASSGAEPGASSDGGAGASSRARQARIVAKAGTNAIASGVMQLGGVYTVREERGKGLAAALTAFLAESAAQKGMATVLFVNKKNLPAAAAYRKAGFVDSGKDYTIEYYDR